VEPLESRPNLPRPRQPVEPARVPRRFGVGTLLLLVTLYGLLFSLLQATGAPAAVYLVVAGFLTIIALAQMLLFEGKKPRLASFLAGGVCGSVLALCGAIVDASFGHRQSPDLLFESFLVGGLLGYATGCLLAGVFLFLNTFRKREPDPPDDSPFAAEDVENTEHDRE
jgi:drug/metabolite transporter (DMT)-like permease